MVMMDDLINRSIIEKLRNDSLLELRETLDFIIECNLVALGEHAKKDIAEFNDKNFQSDFLNALVKRGQSETETSIRSDIINIILFCAPPKDALELAKSWLKSVTQNIHKETMLLHSIVTVLDKCGEKLDKDVKNKKSYFCNEAYLIATDYMIREGLFESLPNN